MVTETKKDQNEKIEECTGSKGMFRSNMARDRQGPMRLDSCRDEFSDEQRERRNV